MIECESVAPARRFPAEPRLGKSALPALLREVEIDVVETLTTMDKQSWSAAFGAIIE
jgi:hypothetical protein